MPNPRLISRLALMIMSHRTAMTDFTMPQTRYARSAVNIAYQQSGSQQRDRSSAACDPKLTWGVIRS
jgi:hypothetical protein